MVVPEDVDVVTTLSTGVLSYGCVNAISCFVQGRFLGISTGTMAPIPSLVGVMTVITASFVSHTTAVCFDRYCKERKRNKPVSSSVKIAWAHRPSIRDRQNDPLAKFWSTLNGHNPYVHTLRICIVGIVCFKVLGGRFWSIAPSSYTHVGSYARASIAATDQYATQNQRAAIQRLGRIFGCHTCGTKSSIGSFIGDHQPPKSVAYQLNQQWYRRYTGWKVPFRFYPHCTSCSNKQGGILASATLDIAKTQSWNQWFKRTGTPNVKIPSLRTVGGGQKAYLHGQQPRLHYITGGILAAIATMDTSDQGRQRYIDAQSFITKVLKVPYQKLDSFRRQFDRQYHHPFNVQSNIPIFRM